MTRLTMAANLSVRRNYGWLLLTGWFLLLAAVFSYAIVAQPRPREADGIAVVFAMLAFLAYAVAMKRRWMALGLFVFLLAGMLTIVLTGWLT